ncbi:MAG: hypothetical protein BRD30_06110 [Bacteroidetes bacterium QH_2_63_10]|nr:MAG: hypothetical protein BRD30_06110 [Bacteroidetes bacterium QH_2_63_10]
MRGRVTDTDGKPLPGANVVVVHVPSGTRYGASTNQNGNYNLANLRVGGPYQVTASFVGYQSKREEGIRLNLGQTLRLNFTLRERTAELEEVEVVAKRGGILSDEKTGVGTSISSTEIDAAPTQGRKLADITRLVPQSFVGNDDDDGPAVSFAGQNTDFNSIFIDGAVSNDVFGLSAQGTDGGQTGATPISLSAIEAFNVDISPFDVTQSGFTGAAINAVTKSGTNEFEGSSAATDTSAPSGGPFSRTSSSSSRTSTSAARRPRSRCRRTIGETWGSTAPMETTFWTASTKFGRSFGKIPGTIRAVSAPETPRSRATSFCLSSTTT